MYDDSHYKNDGVNEILPDCSGTYDEVVADTSVYEIMVYVVSGSVKGENDILLSVTSSFDVETYENPRKSLGIDVEYSGSTKAGTVIDSDCEDIEVTESFETILGKGSKNQDWTINKSATLKAGKTSTVSVVVGDRSEPLKVTCTTMTESQYKSKCVSRNYKNQLRKASYDQYIKIYGQVLQDCGSGYFRISSSGGYDDVYMVYAPTSDIVEDDWVTVYGQTDGIYNYETVLGATKKIPEIDAKYIDR